MAAMRCHVFNLSILDLLPAMRQYRCRDLAADILILVVGMIFEFREFCVTSAHAPILQRGRLAKTVGNNVQIPFNRVNRI